MKQLVYWGMSAGIALLGLYLVLHRDVDSSLVAIAILVWSIGFQLYQQLQAERRYRRSPSDCLRVIELSWLNVLTYTGALVALGLNVQRINFPVVLTILGSILIALGLYGKTVKLYTITNRGILSLTQDRLIDKKDIRKIEANDSNIRVMMQDGSDALIFPIQKVAVEKRALFDKLLVKNEGA